MKSKWFYLSIDMWLLLLLVVMVVVGSPHQQLIPSQGAEICTLRYESAWKEHRQTNWW